MNNRSFIFLISLIILLSFSCSSNQEQSSFPQVETETNVESGISDDSQNIISSAEERAALIRLSDSMRKVAAAESEVACSYEYGEDMDFKKYVIIILKNNTKGVINSVRLNIEFSSFQSNIGNENNVELDYRISINPGKSKKIRYYTEDNIEDISVVKYYSNGKAESNGLQSLIKQNRRKLNNQFPPVIN